MEGYNKQKQKRNVEQVNFYMLPAEKKKIVEQAKKEMRSVSNYIKTKILEATA